ncbi:MAG TPA: glycosyltransferase [Ideonella sp.]|uniref:glycosyltransferase n=1 Tax=Ideonella sp. TaxID=1929293 RepID=UPI002D0A5AB8|nr:glycosyltransferase [Ideonella sp.]HSI50564.1 glycosyltransferase [Ideonella sp.]
MRVLHVLRDLSRNGGVQRLVHDLALAGLRRGQQPEVVVFHRDAGLDYADALRAAGVPVHHVARWQWLRLAGLLRRADAVHAHLFPALYLVGLMKPGSVYTEHNTTNNRRKRAWLQPAERFMYRRYRHVTCISPEVQQALRGFLRTGANDNSCVIYNGVNQPALAAQAQAARQLLAGAEGSVARGYRLAMVGSMTPKKDQATLIRALAKLPVQGGHPASLHLAGDGPEREALLALARAEGVAGQVVFHGVVADVPAWLAGMDLYVQSSKWEGFGLAAIEAMACGLPVLCADVPGLSQLANDSSLLFKQGDADQLAAMVQDCRSNPARRAHLLAVGQETAVRYSVETLAAELERLYAAPAPSVPPGAAQPRGAA